MEHIMIWLRTDDYDRWQGIHDGFYEQRKEFGIVGDHVYRDVREPNAAFVHLEVEDVSRAMGWMQSDTFREATQEAKVTDRAIYTADQRQ